MAERLRETRISRRSMLKRIAATGAVAWSAPILTSVRTPAFGLDYFGGCPALPQAGVVSTTVTAVSAANSLEYGLASPSHVVVCSPCGGGESANLGHFDAGTTLAFYLTDLTCRETFTCPHPFVKVVQTSPTTWEICFDDAGGGCIHHDPPCHCNLCATVTLTPD